MTRLIVPLASFVLLAGACKKKKDTTETIVVKDNGSYASISTAAVDSITSASAVSGGVVSSEGSSAITAVGICWDTKSGPTTLRAHTYEGAGTGTFRSVINGLLPGTTYFVRAYATNALGTAYGNEVTFKTPVGWKKVPSTGITQFQAIMGRSSRLFAASSSDSRIYVSDNEGVTWAASSSVLPDNGNCFAIFNNNILVGTAGSGVYSSFDNGNTWLAINSGMSGQAINCLLVSGNTIFAGTSYYGVFRSMNGGQNWSQVNGGITDNNIQSLTSIGSTILAGTNTQGVFRSTDNGASWTASNSGLSGAQWISSLAVCGQTVLAAGGSGLFSSTNNGANWTSVSGVQWAGLDLLATGKNAIAWQYNFVSVSTDNGATWLQNTGGLNNNSVNAIGTNGSSYFACTSSGEIYKLPVQ